MKRILFAAVVLALAGVLSASIAFFVSEREFVIVTEFGRVVQVIKEPGLAFKKPGFINRLYRLDKRTQILDTQIIQLLLGDKNPVIMSCYVLWRIKDPQQFFIRLQNPAAAAAKLEAMVTSNLGGVLGDFSLSDILKVREIGSASITSLLEIEHHVREKTNTSTQAEYGVEVLDVGIQRLSYPAQVTEAVYQRMRAERRKEANKIRAEGREEATKISARTNKEAAEIYSKAKEKAEIIKGEGDRAAMETYAKAYGRNQEYFRFTKSLELYSNVLRMNSLLVFSTESGLFSYLGKDSMETASGSALPRGADVRD